MYYLFNTRFCNLPTLAAVTLLSACASAPKASISPNADIGSTVSQLDSGIKSGYDNQVDLLDNADFTNAQERLNKAKREISDKDSKDDIMANLSEAQGYLDRANTKAGDIAPKAKGILDARKSAISAGARNVNESGLKDADDNVRSVVEKLQTRDLSPDKWSALQASYLKLEVEALDAKNLNGAVKQVNGAIENGARSYAPHLLKQTEWAVRDSKNVIATQTHNPATYGPTVIKANQLAQLLTEVVAATDGGKVPEDAAQKIVLDRRKIARLQGQVGEVSGQVAAADAQLTAQSGQITLDSALASAQKQFSPSEAEAYRQGNKLLLRLKGIEFAVGKSELPASALSLLNKAKSIALTLKPSAVVVEGNTDGAGSAKLNKTLSENRAKSVAAFLSQDGVAPDKISAVGNGFEKPLASNKTSSGRAQNRRVDILITPTTSNTPVEDTLQ